jgi:hypothetical protein
MFLVMDEQAEEACRVTFGSGELLRLPVTGLGAVLVGEDIESLHAADSESDEGTQP